MAQAQRSTAVRVLLALLGLAALLLGAFRVLTVLDAALLMGIDLLLWKGILKPEAPSEANDRFWTLFNGTSDAIFMRIDARFMGTTSFMDVNDMACERLGYTRKELLRLRPADIDTLEPGAVMDRVRTQLAEQGRAIFETTFKTKAGATYPVELHVHRVDLQGKPVMLTMARDITGRRQTEQLMRRLSQVVEQSPVSIIITDRTGAIEFVNPRLEASTGYTCAELLGQNPRIFKAGLAPQDHHADLWATISAGKVWEGEFQNRKKSGELYWERATVSPLTDAAGAITHYLGIKEDVTTQKHLQSQLRHSQKLEAVGQLAGGVAHDFNNILQVINGYGTLMQMTMPEQDANRNALGEILKAAERAAHLTHSLLAFSRKQVMDTRTVDLNAVVTNVDKFLRRVIGEDIQLRTLRAPEPLTVRVDIGQIEQVLMNLATNARDAMAGGGALTIATEAVATDGRFEPDHAFGKPGHYALLTVTDSGAGMDEATRKRIFDPFFTTKEMGRGTGLGLSIVYGIIKQHGGYITAHSEPGQGTAFRIYLPIVHSAEDAPIPAATGPTRVKGTETVLVAEDEPGVRSMIELILVKHGYRVILAEDGQDAVEKFQANRDAIQLILMDIIMPRKGGRQAYDEIRQLAPQVKVLFTSGYTADFIKSRGDLDQGMELVMKPVQPMELLRKMRDLLDRSVADAPC
jgi:two-component system NtrC family sensor kinase